MSKLNRMSGALATVVALAACALILSCSSEAQTNPCPDGTEPYTEYRLFFGRGDADNPQVVSDQQWEGFLEDTITVEFPAGLTVLDAYGQYTDSAGNLIKEDTKVLIILVPPDADSAPGIDRIIEEYKQRFSQQGVLREVKATCASF
ncbi:MAG: DUF3574 domain-containing protein [Candidatus Dadabacteria bacterium]|nr:DUF3574 domain-containing protein [Candidatus Dadabacteria bacterium]MYC40647.1 DUF3574 domain-containing protein [Candidatus Dadabacteria bacterium]MYH40130.1 DUF3574 domain-containing protein [Candidatus Dadabacteria bacterium]